jgi:hypothetical protein
MKLTDREIEKIRALLPIAGITPNNVYGYLQ